MSTSGNTAFRVLLVFGAIGLLAVVGLGVLYLVGPRTNVEQDPVLTVEEMAEEEASSGSRVYALDRLPETLVLLDYTLEPDESAVQGALRNDTSWAYADVVSSLTCILQRGTTRARWQP